MSIISNLTDRAYNSYIESTQVAAKPGIVVLNPDGSSLTGVGSAGINQAGTASAANSTTTTLLGNAVFTGTSESTLSYEGITVTVFADQASASNGLSIQQSKDGTHWDVTDTYTVEASTTLSVSVLFVAENFRVVYTNGAAGQGAFRLDTVKKPILNPFSHVATLDTAVGQNIIMENPSLFSGTANFERSRSTTALSQTTLNGTLNSYTNSGLGVPIELMMGWDRTAAAQAYRAISLGSDGTVGIGTSAAVADGTGNTFAILTTPGGTNNSAPLGVFPMVYNGATWDRVRSDGTTTGRLLVGGAGTAGTPAGGVLSVQGVASGTVLPTNVTQFGSNAVVTGTGAGGLGIPRVTLSNDSSLAANQSVNIAQIAGTATSVGNGLTGTGVQRVTISSDSTGQVTLATGANTIGALTANQSVNSAQVSGTAVSVNNGTVDAGTQRVTLASNSTGQVTLAAGAAVIGAVTQSGTWNIGTLTTLSQFPATAALADATANPTLSEIQDYPMLFNGTTWDRNYNNWTSTVTASAAQTASFNSADQTNFNARGVVLTINVTAQSGTTPTLDAKVQLKDPTSGQYTDLPNASFTQFAAATGTKQLVIYPGITTAANAAVSSSVPRVWRMAYTIAGTTPSFTFSLGASYTI